VAQLVGVATNTIWKWETGKTEPTWSHLKRWLAVMDIEVGFRPAPAVGADG
jgi:transcriptional regulator with XRE-family HTH domain